MDTWPFEFIDSYREHALLRKPTFQPGTKHLRKAPPSLHQQDLCSSNSDCMHTLSHHVYAHSCIGLQLLHKRSHRSPSRGSNSARLETSARSVTRAQRLAIPNKLFFACPATTIGRCDLDPAGYDRENGSMSTQALGKRGSGEVFEGESSKEAHRPR